MGAVEKFKEEFKSIISRLQVVESDWKFVTSGGAELTVGTPIVHLGVNATGGAIWIKKDSDAKPTRLDFGGIGGSAGLSAIPFPGNFSFSLPAMPSAGTIYKLPFAGKTLRIDDMKGAFVLMEIGGDVGVGGTGGLMFLGGSVLITQTIQALPGGTMLALPALISTSKACVRFGGLSVTLLPANVSISVYLGLIF